jgi:hypothetical protein
LSKVGAEARCRADDAQGHRLRQVAASDFHRIVLDC